MDTWKKINRVISVAPMMDWTDRHDRFFLRLIAPQILLYSEMITTNALIHGDSHYLLSYHPAEHPLALQLGGSNPQDLAHCAKLAEDYQYDEVNLNVGCPSDRVKSGSFGACLMLEPYKVADCVHAMQQVVKIPITVKCRIGVDNHDTYEELQQFIKIISSAGCQVFIIHARKAWLNGLSPKQNREIPPLRYDVVKKIKEDFPYLTIILNGGIKTIDTIKECLSFTDGVMIGREAYSNPYFLAEIDKEFYQSAPSLTRADIIEKFIPYVESQLKNNIKLTSITRHILGLFLNQVGGKKWRRYLSEHSSKKNAGIEVIKEALNQQLLTIKDNYL